MRRRMLLLGQALAVSVLVAWSCGEVASLRIDVRPSQVDFPAVKQALLTVGCSRTGCHGVIQGDFLLDPDDNSPAQLEQEYLLAKAFVNLNEPDESTLVRAALKGDPAADSHRFLCFESANACAYRKVDAWLRASEPGDPGPDDIDCEPLPDACLNIR